MLARGAIDMTIEAQHSPSNVVEVEHLRKYFKVGAKQYVYAVDDVNLSIGEGETLGLVGESGCGKSTLGRTIVKLIEPTSGNVRITGFDIARLNRTQLQACRRQMQIIFHDPFSSLNPRMTAEEIVGEPFVVHKLASGSELRERVVDLLRPVGF